MTNFASPDDEARALAAGFNAFIAKPFDSQSVVAVVAKLLKDRGDCATLSAEGIEECHLIESQYR
jgi:CheY-like chemotaxis protein